MIDTTYSSIEKEDVAALHFPLEDVLDGKDEKKIRSMEIQRAEALGNLEHHKVHIFFEDDKEKRHVHTTIWAVTDLSILLKQNVVVPINRIHKLEI